MISKLPAKKNLSETALAELRSAILEGKISPGTRLIERTLADGLGISRTPVHEALKVLLAEKLVSKLPNNGFMVAQIEKKDIVQLYEIRLQLEPLAVQWALPHISPSIVKRLKKNVACMEKCLAESDMKRIRKANVQFHQIILAAARSHVLTSFIEQVQANARLFQIRSLSVPGRTAQVIKEHAAIIEALEKSDEAAAVASMKEHLSNALNWRLLSLESMLDPDNESGVKNEEA
jgi:DNA-binding GntR family transcriptional regulator